MLTNLRRIVLEFSQAVELDKALERMTSEVKRVMNTDCCSVHLADYQKQHFLLVASDGLAKESLGQTTIGFSEGLIGLVGQREEPLNLADARKHAHFKYAPEVKEDELNAFLGTPIIHQGQVLGVISIQQKEARHFTETEESFLVTLSAQLAASLAHAQNRGWSMQRDKKQQVRPYIQGVAGSPGVAIAPIFVRRPKADLRNITLEHHSDSKQQIELLKQAIRKTRAEFIQITEQLQGVVNEASVDIFEMYKHLLESEQLGQEIHTTIEQGWCAQSALKIVIDAYVVQFEALEDEYVRERASDIRDLANRILQNLQEQDERQETLPETFIVVAEEVTASMLADLQHQGLQGVVSLSGSNNSHAAILARALGVPAIMGVQESTLTTFNHAMAIVDGYSGELFINPEKSLLKEYQHLVNEEIALVEKIKTVETLPSVTVDGRCVELQLNAGLSSGFEHSKRAGAKGVGLYRTEIPFMESRSFPSEQEQSIWYYNVLTAFENQPVTMRTLDIGGDKSLPYFPIKEENPFLGWRGVRISIDHPELFLLQVRAMIRANVGCGNLEIMLPMISSLVEVDEAIRLINQAYFELCQELNETILKPKIGIMIEVPSALFLLPELAGKVDFFSVGSNDLTQYLLAVDRNNARVAHLYNAYHPSVIRALYEIAKQAKQHAVPLSLCGELAGDAIGAVLLVAMGYDKLSMNPHNVGRIKWIIRHISMEQAQAMLANVLTLTSAKEIKNYLNEQLEAIGLGGFVRAGM
ncbi:phosphoenolpyruvate--protein phosphotransferase [Thalassotalea sp. LPB0316]|uniref:phosphoenolpyruvate--protein phosphotransferase n=1 Tax=Thalassotalea sp. LPB0316 TaxID=2769490 RepID=UPI0018689601|nr:phosphoenolpyruvate--protein phosphotransferase [Thalassotalea sp. LPB0316]QOL25555.1 phosphoenolpyruvate--protein phosphotransferase [Thalassotalea sp. LPB0316]